MTMDARVERLFPGGDVVVDLGCGDGTPLDDLGARYRVAVGFDIGAGRIRARGGSDGWTFSLADLNQGIPLGDGVADALFANQVIEHVANPLVFANEARRVLRTGGRLVVTTPNVRYVKHIWSLVGGGAGPMTSSYRARTIDDWDGGHIHYFTPDDLAWIMHAAGFSECETSALIAPNGGGRWLRPALSRWAHTAPVKNFLSGNTLMTAVK